MRKLMVSEVSREMWDQACAFTSVFGTQAGAISAQYSVIKHAHQDGAGPTEQHKPQTILL